MATIATEVLTYADLRKRLGPDDKIGVIIELLQQWHGIVDDMMMRECNNGARHKTTVRTGLPTAAWRLLNYGVPKGKSRTAQVEDTTGMLATYSQVDKTLAELSKNQSMLRMSEAQAFLEGMRNQVAETIFYGDTSINPERFLGLAPRYSALTGAESSANVINGLGTDVGGQTSIWLITWGDLYTHGLFPQGTNGGLQHRDLGEDTVLDPDGGEYQALRDYFEWHIGLTVRDWRYNVRIANVETDKITNGADLTYIQTIIGMMIEAEERLNQLGTGRHVWYVNRRVRTALRRAILEKVGSNLTWETVEGKRVMMFDGIPVVREDAILLTEAVVA